jgi:hypothetical protein
VMTATPLISTVLPMPILQVSWLTSSCCL